MSKFETKNALLGIFGLEFENKHLQICLIAKFRKRKTKKSLNLRVKMPYLGTVALEFEKAISPFEINTLKFV